MDASGHDPQHDFDFEFGSWRTQLRRLLHPLSGADEWAEYAGISVVHPLWDGRANLVELDAEGPAGRIRALSLRLYDPGARRWSLHAASASGADISPASIGGFADGRGVFTAAEEFGGRPVLVRFVISDITADACRFEQAFSVDDGASWEVNWIAHDTRIGT